MKLEALQALFWNSVRADPSPVVDEAFVSRGPLGARERLAIYRTAYWVRQVVALRELFPRVVAELGDGPFARTASRYVGAHPSTSFALEHLGTGFPAWVGEAHGAGLGELAAVEYASWEVFVSPDAPRVGVEAARRLGFAAARLRLGEHLRVVPVTAASMERLGHREAQGFLVVWREGFEVLRRTVSPVEAKAIALGRQTAGVVELCDALLGEGGAEQVFAALFGWFERGWVVFVEEGHG